MRLLLVEPSGRGFLSHYTHALALGLQRIGVEVHLMTGKRDELAELVVPFRKFYQGNGGRSWHCIRRHVVMEKPDVVHLQWVGNPFSALLFVRWAQRRGVKVVYTPHNILPHEYRWLLLPAFRLLYRRLDRVVARDAHIAWALEELLGMTRERLAQLSGSPNILALYKKGNRNESVPQKTTHEHRLLFFGHGGAGKGLDRLLSVVEQNEWPESLRLILAGEEVLRGVSRELFEAASRRMPISIVDQYVAPSAVADIFRDADLLLMPYSKLCKSPLLDLAAVMGLPVLRSDRVQGADFIEGVHGATYAYDDTLTLYRLIIDRGWVGRAAAKLEDVLEDPVAAMDRLAEEHARLYRKVTVGSQEHETAISILPVPQSR